MTNPPILKGRTAAAVAVPDDRETLDVALQKATAIARAGDMLPKSYRGQPGAIVLAMDWADRHGLSIMDAIHGVAWVQGRPVIDASLQRALAQNAGYRVLVEDVSTESATVTVASSTGELLGRATYTMDEARTAGLAGKDNWKKNPADMLVARASTRAIKWFCPGVLIGGALSPEELEQTDPIAVLDPQEPVADSPEDGNDRTPEVPTPEAPAEPEITDAEIVEPLDEPLADDPITPETKGQVRAAFETAKAEERYVALAEAMKAEGLTLRVAGLTEAEGQRALELAEVAR